MTYFNQSFIFVLAVVFMIIGVLYQVAIGVIYQNMIQATDSMTATDNKLLKQCKQRFVQCYKLNGGVSNIPVFVDKFLNKVKFLGMSIPFMKHLSGQLMLAGVFIAGFGVCKGIIEGSRFSELLPFYIVSLFGIYIFLSVTSIVDVPGRRQVIKTNLTDYLENHIAERLENGLLEKEKLLQEIALEKEAVRKKSGGKEENPVSESVLAKQSGEDTGNVAENEQKQSEKGGKEVKLQGFSEEEALELEELLRSFMA